MGATPESITVVFGNCFLHRSTTKIFEFGQIAVTMDEINPDKHLTIYQDYKKYVNARTPS